ncbi:hypothetical protein KFU94_36485 [Chloroflexi bacterium TSY]|nr:hypothetical protein [Chloroflexi bacterium TSY]
MIENTVAKQIFQFSHKWLLYKAIKSAYRIWKQRHPTWRDACFDEHFLTHSAYSHFAEYIHGESELNAKILARIWVDQFHCTAEKQEKFMREIEPIAADFLYLFDTEFAYLAGRRSPVYAFHQQEIEICQTHV